MNHTEQPLEMVATTEDSSAVAKQPCFIRSVVEMDCYELRDMADWFDQQGKKSNGDFLRSMATRHEILFGAYETANGRAAAPHDRGWREG
ncbi:hypothetical protein MNJPNG_04755 [Cupriavidus oxalaticus]|uniref:hypothetical protein n=1 Tax=Cupriavidus oxalaticus TaxID=96344 RepID=UPI003F73CE04